MADGLRLGGRDVAAVARFAGVELGGGLRQERARERLAALSDREREVALAVGEGRANAEIAAALHMSVATVKAHVSRLLAKLDADNRVQIALLVQDARR